MEIIKIVIIIISTVSLAFFIFQLWFFLENQDYIYEFNNKYSKLENIVTPNLNFLDKSIFDPNDSEINVENKFRCVSDNIFYYAVSRNGFFSSDSLTIGYRWNNVTDCIINLFRNNNLIIYNPCSINNNHLDCILLNTLMLKST